MTIINYLRRYAEIFPDPPTKTYNWFGLNIREGPAVYSVYRSKGTIFTTGGIPDTLDLPDIRQFRSNSVWISGIPDCPGQFVF